MFSDKTSIFIKAGDGGDGCTSFYTEKYVPNGGPDGGDGGKGGDVIFQASDKSATLSDFKRMRHYRAENGFNGSSKRRNGKAGKDLIIQVPRGTVIKDYETGGIIADMYHDGQCVTVLKGGAGGKGNARFKTSRRQAPHFSQTGEKTEEHEVILELKLIADVGLVGYPNAGKSTLLSVLTRANPKIGNYKFTTLTPNIGVSTEYGYVLADIPGIIDGAADGAGLGLEFLRHIERTRVIIHVVDITAADGGEPYENYLAVRRELKAYGADNIPEIVALNKIDAADEKAVAKFKTKYKGEVYPISAFTHKGTAELEKAVYSLLSEQPPSEPLEFSPFEYKKADVNEFEVYRADDGAFVVDGAFVTELARNTVLDDKDSFMFFQRRLKEGGVIKALLKKGMVDGDTVRVLDVEFEYRE